VDHRDKIEVLFAFFYACYQKKDWWLLQGLADSDSVSKENLKLY